MAEREMTEEEKKEYNVQHTCKKCGVTMSHEGPARTICVKCEATEKYKARSDPCPAPNCNRCPDFKDGACGRKMPGLTATQTTSAEMPERQRVLDDISWRHKQSLHDLQAWVSSKIPAGLPRENLEDLMGPMVELQLQEKAVWDALQFEKRTFETLYDQAQGLSKELRDTNNQRDGDARLIAELREANMNLKARNGVLKNQDNVIAALNTALEETRARDGNPTVATLRETLAVMDEKLQSVESRNKNLVKTLDDDTALIKELRARVKEVEDEKAKDYGHIALQKSLIEKDARIESADYMLEQSQADIEELKNRNKSLEALLDRPYTEDMDTMQIEYLVAENERLRKAIRELVE